LGQGRHIVLPDGADTAKAGENDGWMRLSPQETALPEHHPLPWSFVLSPGVLPIGGRDEWLTGVLTASRDSTGRPWPLVIYQRAGREWLEESLDDTQGWLY
ncbi:TagF domain-containing protein, partial [Escherichia coli]|nr:TagF domain-containing protein [Escherichia coli]